MQIHRVRGKTLDEALRSARAKHGDGALVVEQTIDGRGTVTLAVANGDPDVPGKQGEFATQAARVLPCAATPTQVAPPVKAEDEAGLREVASRLGRSGCSPEFVEKITGAVARLIHARPDLHPIDAASAVIGSCFTIAHSKKSERDLRVVAFFGPTGVGKTSVLVRLAVHLVKAGRRVGMASADTQRIGAVEQLQAIADTLEVPLQIVERASEIERKTVARSRPEVVLLDTPGSSPADRESVEVTREVLARSGAGTSLESYLVLAATASAACLRKIDAGFAACRPTGCIITRLDETDEPGPILEYVAKKKLPVAFLSNGANGEETLLRANPELFGTLLLRGGLC